MGNGWPSREGLKIFGVILETVAEFARRGDDRGDGKLDAGQVLQELGDLALLPRELLGVGEVLVLAATAAAEERAAGGHA